MVISVNTEMPVDNVGEARGWIFYDAQCPFCRRQCQRWGPTFARRGFVWLPLQTPGTANRLGVTESELRREMKLLRTDGRVLGGVEAWAVLLRSVGWLRPVGWLLACPGLRDLAGLGYRWVARHRYCLGGTCPLPQLPLRRHRAFLEFP